MRESIGIFQEKFRAQTIDEVIAPSRIRNMFADGDIDQHYLFHSVKPGTGKTTLARVIGKGKDYLEIKASENGKIATLREDVRRFVASSNVFDSNYQKKVVLFDEVDGASNSFFEALRNLIEDPALVNKVFFIATCNNMVKIPEPVRESRLTMINFEHENENETKEVLLQLVKRMIKIVQEVGMTISKEAAIEFVKRRYPDMRKMLNELQVFYRTGVEEITKDMVEKFNYSEGDESLFNLCISKPDPYNNYTNLIDVYKGKEDETLIMLANEFPVWLFEHDKQYRSEVIEVTSILAEACYKMNFSLNKGVTFLNTVWELQKVFNTK